MGEFLGRVTSTCKCVQLWKGRGHGVVWYGVEREGDGLKAYAEASL